MTYAIGSIAVHAVLQIAVLAVLQKNNNISVEQCLAKKQKCIYIIGFLIIFLINRYNIDNTATDIS